MDGSSIKNGVNMKKGSWEAVFGHLGTPEEVAQEWEKTQDEIAKLRDELALCKLQETCE